MDVPSTPPPRAVGVEDGDIELRPFSGASSLFSSVGADAGYLSDGAGDEDAAPAEPVVVAAPVYLTGVSLVLVAAAATMAVFLTMLDTSIVATAVCENPPWFSSNPPEPPWPLSDSSLHSLLPSFAPSNLLK